MASRTLEEIREQLLRLGPWWLGDPEEVADAVVRAAAATLERLEGAVATLHARTLIGEADGSWLDEHGFERTRPRLSDELDDAYRERIRAWPDAVTKPSILAAVNAVLAVGEARMEEWYQNAAYACDAGSGDTSGFADNCRAYAGVSRFTLYIEPQVDGLSGTAWACATGSGAVESFAVDSTGDGVSPADPGAFAESRALLNSPVYARVIEALAALKAAGVVYQVLIEEEA